MFNPGLPTLWDFEYTYSALFPTHTFTSGMPSKWTLNRFIHKYFSGYQYHYYIYYILKLTMCTYCHPPSFNIQFPCVVSKLSLHICFVWNKTYQVYRRFWEPSPRFSLMAEYSDIHGSQDEHCTYFDKTIKRFRR